MPLPRVNFPYRYIDGLEPIAQEQIRRNFEELAAEFGKVRGFISVSADGGSDFTTIYAAVNSVAVGGSAVIIVRQKADRSAYNERTLGTMNIAQKRIKIMGLEGFTEDDTLYTPTAPILWQTNGFVGSANNTVVALESIMVDCLTSGGTAQPLITTGGHVYMNNARLQTGWLDVLTSNSSISGVKSSFQVGSGGSAIPLVLNTINCSVTLGSGTYSGGGNAIIVGGEVTGPSGGTVVWQSMGQFAVIGNFFTNTVPFTWTVTTSSQGNQIHFCDNYTLGQNASSVPSGLFGVIPNFTAGRITFEGNMLMGSGFILQADAAGSISGVYGCQGNHLQLKGVAWTGNFTAYDQQFQSSPLNHVVAVQISAARCVLMIGVEMRTSGSGGAVAAIDVSGNDNVILAVVSSAGGAGWNAAFNNTGTGNSLNALTPTGPAGGGLGGTYPNPTVTPAAGLDTTAIHTGAAAGGSLAGTYVNPTFSGRDSSVDKINQDMLPSLLGGDASGVFGAISFPSTTGGGGGPPSGAAGGSLAGSYPNPTFSGRNASGDKMDQDMLPSLLGGDASGVFGVLVFPVPAPVATVATDFNQSFMLMGG